MKGERNNKHAETENSIWGECDWVIERTNAWITQHWRLSRDFAGVGVSSEALMDRAMSKSILTRLVNLLSLHLPSDHLLRHHFTVL